jgi:lipopolysaccharide/colanic/teichoic acid biosynthesis glycosyltransferase
MAAPVGIRSDGTPTRRERLAERPPSAGDLAARRDVPIGGDPALRPDDGGLVLEAALAPAGIPLDLGAIGFEPAGFEPAGFEPAAYDPAADLAVIRPRVERLVDRADAASPGYLIAKRGFDLLVCLFLLPMAAIVMGLIALAILLDSGRPILFAQERVGRNGRSFRMLKFRTLRSGYDQDRGRAWMRAYVRGEVGQRGHWANKPITADDVTPVGRFLRRTSLDEVPQLLNVLAGQMSIVGPRPNVPWEVASYRDEDYRRLLVTPGITGLAQARGRSGITWDDIVRNDLEYVEHASFWLDLKILWWTVRAVLDGEAG